MTALVRLSGVSLSYPSSRIQPGSIKELMLAPFRKRKATSPVRALRGIDLEVRPGDRIGVVGRNGAGKSTLLRVMAGVYPVDSGVVETGGRIQALLDVNLGFEYEATGRQNIYYRGTLMGHPPAALAEREAEIVSFAGLGEFIDYPVKTYSAGMLVRLAFTISTTMEGEVLLLDEVAGAGDAAFSAKAALRMEELIRQSRALVLVSHDPSAIRRLCGRCIVLVEGRIAFSGDVEAALDFYGRSLVPA